jgi:outer membrane protein assembly factor BamB
MMIKKLALVTAFFWLSPLLAQSPMPTYGADNLRTGWYPDQPDLAPSLVANPSFGQLFAANVTGQVYAQPLVWNGVVLVVTETNDVYGLDERTGSTLWTRRVETPWNAADLGCPDLSPFVGITGTPVIDPATNAAYFFAKTYQSGSSGPAKYVAHSVDVATGEERPGFPVAIEGSPTNDGATVFDAKFELQRPALLLLDGVVYAAFGSHCMYGPYHGYVAGVSTSGALTTLWATTIGDVYGASIWQSGAGIVSDGPGRLFVVTGNTGGPTSPAPGYNPPANLGESAIRLEVQPDGSLVPRDFFAPAEAAALDLGDLDFGSGGPVALPGTPFGLPGHPDLLLAGGKEGSLFLLDRTSLGGFSQGPGGSDAALVRSPRYGGVWGKASVWPGDGGYVWLPTGSPGASSEGSMGRLLAFQVGLDGSGKPALNLVASSPDGFWFGSGAPVVTSAGTASGTALVWLVWCPDGTGLGAQLRAYDAVPAGGAPVLRFSAPISQATKFAAPGVGNGRIYVGTKDGHAYGFGTSVRAQPDPGLQTAPRPGAGSVLAIPS